jgi:hypothetical protein
MGTTAFLIILALSGRQYLAAYAGAIMIGMFLASMFALFITLPG